MIVFLIILGLILLAAVWGVSSYNNLVTLQNRYENAYSQIDVQLKRRYDLIPNLVETAKGYMEHERETLEAVISARNQAVQANSQASQKPGDPEAMQELSGAETQLSGALSRLLMIQENYPDLKADRSMSDLMEELRSTENRVAFARQSYNDAVTSYNTTRESFPASMLANSFNFNQADLFEVELAEERQAPQVSF